MPDIDALVNDGEKLTTIDADEWKKHLSTTGLISVIISCFDLHISGDIITLLLRLPDGTKERVAMPSDTCLKVRRRENIHPFLMMMLRLAMKFNFIICRRSFSTLPDVDMVVPIISSYYRFLVANSQPKTDI